jgi:cytochrome P450
MTVADRGAAEAPRLAAPTPREGRLPLRQALAVLRDNEIAIYDAQSYSADIVEQRLLWRRSVILNEPDAIKHVLLDNAANYHKTEIARRIVEPAIGRGLLTSEGEIWRRHRRIMAPAFDRRSIIAYSPVMTEVALALLARWEALPDGAEIDVGPAMMQATLEVISRTMFARDSDDIVALVDRSFTRFQTEARPGLIDFLGLPAWVKRLAGTPRLEAVFAEFDAVVEALIAARIAAPEDGRAKDLLARLVAARDEETGGGMTSEEVCSQVITFFFAGHETTSLALTWTWYLLSQHPAVEARLEAELTQVLGGRTPCYDDLAKLPYLRMVIEEAMRLYPPAHTLARTALGEDRLLGRRVRPGTMIIISPWLLHRNPKLWTSPERFEPERFEPERVADRHRFAYIPFGAGPRVCIGSAFAMAEAMLILATIAQRCRLRLKPGFPVEPQALLTLRARHGMRMLIERRRAPAGGEGR